MKDTLRPSSRATRSGCNTLTLSTFPHFAPPSPPLTQIPHLARIQIACVKFKLHAFGVINHLSRCKQAAQALVDDGFVNDVLVPSVMPSLAPSLNLLYGFHHHHHRPLICSRCPWSFSHGLLSPKAKSTKDSRGAINTSEHPHPRIRPIQPPSFKACFIRPLPFPFLPLPVRYFLISARGSPITDDVGRMARVLTISPNIPYTRNRFRNNLALNPKP
jgi:hypothetical protein